MSATIIPAEILEAKRREREKQRQQREALAGSILSLLDDNNENTVCVASEPTKEKRQ